jgi:hypothetical protein
LRCLCPGRNAAWPQRAAASCFSQPRVGCGHDALQIRDLNRPPASRRGLFETRPTKAERRLCEGPGSAEHHDAPIPSERVCKSACGASCCTASGTHMADRISSQPALVRQFACKWGSCLTFDSLFARQISRVLRRAPVDMTPICRHKSAFSERLCTFLNRRPSCAALSSSRRES